MDTGQSIPKQQAILVGLYQGQRDEVDITLSMAELAELAYAAGAEVLHHMIQKKTTIEAATYVGTGKVNEIKMAIEALDANIVIFNDELSGAQIRNLEALLEVTVIDRTALILDIFAIRAQTKIAKLQVELAQLKYRLPRLIGLGGALSRTGGGIGTRGPGEQKLEIDRRRIQERVDEIRKQIKATEKNRGVQRKLREKNEIPIVALVGYTNAGKSSIMNQFIKRAEGIDVERQVFEKDMLFATLDTFNRRIILKDKKEFILTDTIGFVSKLPHALIDAFKATLEEAISADILLHVVDYSNDNYKMQMDVTGQVLKELKVNDKPELTVFNKIDLTERQGIVNTQDQYFVSAKTGEGFDALIEGIKKEIFKDHLMARFVIPYSEGRIASYLCETYDVVELSYLENGTGIYAEVSSADYHRYAMYLNPKENQVDEA